MKQIYETKEFGEKKIYKLQIIIQVYLSLSHQATNLKRQS